jgi:Domain of unknown function (DUF5666)
MIRALVVLLTVNLVSGCAGFGQFAMAPSDASSSDSGVGGTGYSDVGGGDRDLDEGVGGTGFATGVARAGGDEDDGVGGTGIFGIISAFGSIVVNGVHIDYEDETPVVVDGVTGSPSDFAIGQVVAVEAEPMGERYQAHLVEVQHAALGPVSDVDPVARTIRVLGQTIEVAPSDRLPEIDEWVRVSGLRGADEQVIATRIDPASPSLGAFVRGIALPSTEETLTLGGLLFDRPLIDGRTIEAGDEVLLRGVMQARQFKVTDFIKAPREPFGGRMTDLLVQGFVASDAAGLHYLAGHNWTLPTGLAPRMPSGEMPAALFRGRWMEGEISVTPQPHIQIPGLLRDLPWALDGERLGAGEFPDLLRDRAEGREFDALTVDPTSLPDIDQVRALVSTKGLPPALLDATRPLTADQLSALMELGGADATAEGIRQFNPALFAAFLANKDAIEGLAEGVFVPAPGEDFDPASMPQFDAMRLRLEEAGIDPSQLNSARPELAAIAGLLRLREAVGQEGFDPSMLPPGLPPGVLLRLQDLIGDQGGIVGRVPPPLILPVPPTAPTPGGRP